MDVKRGCKTDWYSTIIPQTAAHFPLGNRKEFFLYVWDLHAVQNACGSLELSLGSVFPHYVTGLFICLMAQNPHFYSFRPPHFTGSIPLMCLTRQTQRASMLFWFKCLISSVLGTLLFNLQQHFTLQAHARWVVAGVNTTLETRGLVTSCCDGAQRGVHGFAQGQRQWNALVGADAHPFGFLMWPCKNNTADILQDCYAGCELTPLVCLGWPWLVLICSKTSGGPAQLKYAHGRSSSDAFVAVALNSER